MLAVVVFVGHHVRVLLHAAFYRMRYLLPVVVSTVPVAEGGLIAAYDIHIEFIRGRHV